MYEKKVTIGWGWGDQVVPIYGNITNYPLNKTALINRSVMVQAQQNNQTIYERVVRTDHNGLFNSTFVPPADGTIQLSAVLTGEDLQGLTSVVVVEPIEPLIFISIFIAGASTLTTYVWYRQRKPLPAAGFI